MGKTSASIQIPDDVAEALEAFARAQGKTTSEVIVEILSHAFRDHPLRRYIKDGVFDEKAFRADCKQTSDALEKWDREHANEVRRITRASQHVRKLARDGDPSAP